MKKIVSIFMSFIIICMSFLPVNATSINEEGISEDSCSIELIETPEALERIVIEDNLTIPDGYALKQVKTITYNLNSCSGNYVSTDNIVAPQGIIYELRNVRKNTMEFYYVNEYMSDYYDGPANISQKYTMSSEVKRSFDLSIGKSTLTTGVGYDVSLTYTVSKNVEASISKDEILNVRTYINYSRTDFDIYNKWNDSIVEKDAWTAKPIGIIVKLYFISK